MVTTASRSRDFLRKQGYIAECVEHRRGSFIRVDLFGFADVMAYKEKEIILVQAYHKKEVEGHKNLNANKAEIAQWLMAGGKFVHHLWSFKIKNKRKYWSVEVMPITLEEVVKC